MALSSSYSSDDNFSISAEKYLAKYDVLVYLEDSMAQLLEHREENPKVVASKFLCEYFCSLRDGNHTMFREFNFIRKTAHNRASFVHLFWKCFRHIGKKGDLLSIQEYHSLLGLLCPDFPFQLVQKTARIVLIDDALDCLISFSDFIFAFQVQFYYEEFLEKTFELYQAQLQAMHSPRDPVIVPTSGESEVRVHQNQHLPSDGVDAAHFFRAISPFLGNTVDFSTPSASSLKEILFSVSRISFYGFLMAVAKSDAINAQIGRLPDKAQLLEGADLELASQTLKTPRINKQRSEKVQENISRPTKTQASADPAVKYTETLPTRPETNLTKPGAQALPTRPETNLTKPGTQALPTRPETNIKPAAMLKKPTNPYKKNLPPVVLLSDTDSGTSTDSSDTN
ncbi:centriolar satellite-associated tubulin polyglutamylase complex regulator 1-like isoform X2 [Physella acuta]|uniref:centriolar satellite-associated tubulin polyglutamylase complex regulator 1-like isoform X2 n=1 Tax=Physella acuta TaxID=109671 RepID=UPI0027DC694C|nr:centriolar satellite-associated tubulin polyglutamylase complex regulator 1-like isoform X2 [Physella acuta]